MRVQGSRFRLFGLSRKQSADGVPRLTWPNLILQQRAVQAGDWAVRCLSLNEFRRDRFFRLGKRVVPLFMQGSSEILDDLALQESGAGRISALAMDLLFMVLLATGFPCCVGAAGTLPYHLGPLAVGVLVLSVLLAVYAYGRRKEVGELKLLLQDLQEHVGAAPSEEQLDQLNDLIARSQRNFKELIDSSMTRLARFRWMGLAHGEQTGSQLVSLPYTAIIGHKVFRVRGRTTRAVSKPDWCVSWRRGIGPAPVRVRFKKNPRPFYFDCALNAIIKSDEVVGVSALGRDVTEQHEKICASPNCLRRLQEGAYFSTGGPAAGCESGTGQHFGVCDEARNTCAGSGPV